MNLESLTIEELAVAKVKCEESLLFFTRFFYKALRGNKFIKNWHHEIMCNELENTALYHYDLLNINIPPRHSKTELVGINFIAWSLAKNPRANFLYVTASDDLRSETSVRIRDIITHPIYIQMFGFSIKKDQSGKNLWRTDKGGGLKTATIFGQITGFGAGRMIDDPEDDLFNGAIVLDDINKIMDAIANSANNVKANDVILNTILSRKNSPETPIINIQQRAGLNDATATLLEFYRDLVDTGNRIKNLVMPILKDSVPLWPFMNSLESILRLKNHPKTKHVFESQFMQNPKVLAGVLFPMDKLKRFSLKDLHVDNIEARIGVVDTADEGTDYFSFPVINKVGNKFYFVDVMHTDDDLTITKPLSVSYAKKHKLDYMKIETNNQGKEYYRFMKNELNDTTVRGVWSVAHKETRVLMQSAWIIENCYFRDDYEYESNYDIFMQHLTTYLKMVKNQTDDAADVTAAAGEFIKKLFAIR